MARHEDGMAERQYWIAVVAADIVERARTGGYAELSHGQPGFLERVRQGDGLVFYSPRVSDPRGASLQAFTALGRIVDGIMYRDERPDGSQAWRVAVEFASAAAAPIKPMLDELSFVRSREHWGVVLRFGSLRIRKEDFDCIAAAMGCRQAPAARATEAASPAAGAPANAPGTVAEASQARDEAQAAS